jgi:hypothetical protein
MIIDTETIDLQKRFIYDIGFKILDDKLNVVEQRHYIIKQVFDNRELFNTAYYKEKRKFYVSLLKGRKAERVYFGYATQRIIYILKKYKITKVYAYNSSFDKGAFQYTSAFYKVIPPFDSCEFVDIMKLAKPIYNGLEYQAFAIKNGFITEKSNLKKSAEKVYAFLINNPDFQEKHISIPDCEIELVILKATL